MNNIELSCTINESLPTHYAIYKIINNINGKYYIGLHTTNNIHDNYIGSGNLIKIAKNKYGLSAFTKIILFDFDNFEDMNNKEQELVLLSNCYPYDIMSYNLKEGGHHGSLSLQSIEKIITTRNLYYDEWLSNLRNSKKDWWKNMTLELLTIHIEQMKMNGMFDTAGENNPMYGETLSNHMELSAYNIMIEKINIKNKERAKDPEWRKKMSEVTTGENNRMYGKSIFDFMTETEIQQWRKNKSKATKGKNSPMHGKSSWEKCNEEQRAIRIAKFKASIKGKNKGKRCMKMPNDVHYKYVKQEDILKYLSLGYNFYSRNKGKKFKK